MKFTWKMVALVAILLALSLSVSGWLLIDNSFRRQLNTRIDDAQEDMKLYSMTLQALTLTRLGGEEGGDIHEILRTIFAEETALNSYDYRVSTPDGTTLARSQNMVDCLVKPENDTTMQTRIVADGKRYYLLTTQMAVIGTQQLYLERCREVSDVFSETRESVGQYQLRMLLILAVGTALTAVLTVLLTRPIRRISRTAKQLSMGRYEKRVRVRSKDELGQLARDFNEMAASLETKIHELAEAAQKQKDFTAGFAHELKTPLTSVIGYADTLRSRELPREQQIEAADYIFSEGKRLEAMSFALLDLFSLEREKPEFRRTSTTRLAEETMRSCRYLLEQKGVEAVIKVEEAELFLSPDVIRSLLYNLIDNARKATQTGGHILLRGASEKEGFRFSVIDDGCGIPPEALDRLTEPFYMVDKSRARANGGAGLGLALCSRIAEVHGSRLEFSSTVGRGTCVSFLLKEVRQ